jgi:uncharacterized protein (DUF433 family)
LLNTKGITGVTLRTFRSLFGYTDEVLQSKPVRQAGQDLRDVPTYTIPEVAAFLAVPPRTMHYWFSKGVGMLKPSGSYYGDIALLSFRDVAEAYVVEVLRSVYGFNLSTLHSIVANARRETGLERPLTEANLLVLFRKLILAKPARGRRPRQMIDLGQVDQLVIPELVDLLGERILVDKKRIPYCIYPWRLLSTERASRPVSMAPDVLSGRLVVTGTRIPVRILLGQKLLGRSQEEIAENYHISLDAVQKALAHIERPILKAA